VDILAPVEELEGFSARESTWKMNFSKSQEWVRLNIHSDSTLFFIADPIIIEYGLNLGSTMH